MRSDCMKTQDLSRFGINKNFQHQAAGFKHASLILGNHEEGGAVRDGGEPLATGLFLSQPDGRHNWIGINTFWQPPWSVRRAFSEYRCYGCASLCDRKTIHRTKAVDITNGKNVRQ